MTTIDHYKRLQVDPEADAAVIRAAYRVLAARHHPDVGGSEGVMTELNGAWSVLSDPARRRAYDRERRLRNGTDRWDPYAASYAATDGPAPAAAGSAPAGSYGTVLEFGRYAGWSIPEVAVRDPDYLEWLIRTPNGRRYRTEIEEAIAPSAVATATPPSRRPAGVRWRRR